MMIDRGRQGSHPAHGILLTFFSTFGAPRLQVDVKRIDKPGRAICGEVHYLLQLAGHVRIPKSPSSKTCFLPPSSSSEDSHRIHGSSSSCFSFSRSPLCVKQRRLVVHHVQQVFHLRPRSPLLILQHRVGSLLELVALDDATARDTAAPSVRDHGHVSLLMQYTPCAVLARTAEIRQPSIH